MNIQQMKVLLEMAKKYNLPDSVIAMPIHELQIQLLYKKHFVSVLEIYHPETNKKLIGCGEKVLQNTWHKLYGAGVDFVFVEPA